MKHLISPNPYAPTKVKRRKARYYDELKDPPPLESLRNRFAPFSERQPKSEKRER